MPEEEANLDPDGPLSEGEKKEEVTKETFEEVAMILLNLAIEGHPRAIRSIYAKRNQVLRDFDGDQEAAVTSIMEYKPPEKTMKEQVAHLLVRMMPGINISVRVVYPMWIQVRNTCLLAAALGYDMSSEETHAQVIQAFAGVKTAVGAEAGLSMALQMAWTALAGPVAALIPVGSLVGEMTDLASKGKAEVLAKLREGKTGPVGPDIYTEELDPEPTMEERWAVLKEEFAPELKKHAEALAAKAHEATKSKAEKAADMAKNAAAVASEKGSKLAASASEQAGKLKGMMPKKLF